MARQLKPLPSQSLKDAGVLTQSSPFSLHPFGTGPYRFVSWVKGSAFKVEANPDYWGGVPCMKQITQTIIPDINTLDSALQSGQIDASIVPGPADLGQLRQDSSLKVYTMPPLTPEGLYFNLRAEPWKSNPKLRQAVAYAIDFRAFAKEFMAGTSNSPASFLSPASWAYDAQALPPQYDPKKAAQLLAEAGYPGGKGLTVDINTNAGNLFRQQEETFVQAELGKVGINVNLERHEWGQFITTVMGGKFDVAAVNGGDNAGIPDPTAVESTYETNGANNYSGYSNPQVDQLLAQAGSISDVGQRRKLYDQVQQILAQDLPFLPSFWRPNPLVVKASIHGVAPGVTGAYWNIQDWSNR
jgi:peptide/nickel transport system substrate-binding protein